MRDRLSTKILSNGATRYGVYDETGNLLRYEYIKLEDEPTVEGDFFSKANILPDSIPAALGLKMENPQVKDALNVLANIGNLHVWERVQTYSEPVPEVPAGYTLGEVETDVVVSNKYASNYNLPFDYATELNISSDGTISLKNPSTREVPIANFGQSGVYSNLAGHFFVLKSSVALERFRDVIWYMPEDGTASVSESGSVSIVTLSKMQSVSFRPYTPAIPAGTTTDYLTSTDRNSYPDQSQEGGQNAYYTLGDTLSNYDLGQTAAAHVVTYSSDIDVDDDGTVTLVNSNSIITSNVESLYDVSILLGKFVTTSIDSSGSIVFIPTDATASYNQVNGWSHIFMSKYQPVTGHAAIPANATITYLGQLGGGARIEVGSYVGTETYGKSNPNTLTFGFEPQLVAIFAPSKDGNYAYKVFMLRNVLGSSIFDSDGNNRGVIVTWSEKSVSWYSGSSNYQMNYSGYTYNYIAIG